MSDDLSVFLERYHLKSRKKLFFFAGFLILSGVMIFITLGLGTYHISVIDAIDVFINHITGNIVDIKGDHYVWDVRLPRAMGAAFIGAGLAVGGAVMQNTMNNPLAEPYTVGISSGAFFGAVLSMICGFSVIPMLSGAAAVVLNAFIFSLIPATIIIIISKFKKLTPTAIILLGIAVMYIFSSISQLLMVTVDSESLADVYNWRVGTLAKVTWGNLPIIAGGVSIFSVILYLMSKKLDVMYMGDRNAQTLGLNVARIRLISLIVVSFMTATVVSFTGTIGFIGLVGPHIARIFVGAKNGYLIPCSAVFGAAFVLIADSVAKVSGINGLPVGVISAMVGGPIFLYILIKQRKKVWN